MNPAQLCGDDVHEDCTQRVRQGRGELQEHNTDDLLEVRDDVEAALKASDEGMMYQLTPVCRCRDQTLELGSKRLLGHDSAPRARAVNGFGAAAVAPITSSSKTRSPWRVTYDAAASRDASVVSVFTSPANATATVSPARVTTAVKSGESASRRWQTPLCLWQMRPDSRCRSSAVPTCTGAPSSKPTMQPSDRRRASPRRSRAARRRATHDAAQRRAEQVAHGRAVKPAHYGIPHDGLADDGVAHDGLGGALASIEGSSHLGDRAPA